MTKSYVFECYDSEEKTHVKVAFDTDNDAWEGYNGPLYQFFNFLKGAGFVFNHETEIGVLESNGEFRSATEF